MLYCFLDTTTEKTVYTAFADLLRQLCYHRVPLPSRLVLNWDRRESSGEGARPTVNDLVSDFLSLVPRFSDVVVLIDGLDECQDLADLADPLQRLLRSRCRLFLTSRPSPALGELMLPHAPISLDISATILNRRDLSLDLQSCEQHLGLMETRGTEFSQDVLDQLVQASEGMYVCPRIFPLTVYLTSICRRPGLDWVFASPPANLSLCRAVFSSPNANCQSSSSRQPPAESKHASRLCLSM